MAAAWAIMDKEGHMLPGLVGSSRMAVGRKVLPGRYDEFRLHVSAGYREMFGRDLARLLERNDWQLVRVKTRQTRRAALKTSALPPMALAA